MRGSQTELKHGNESRNENFEQMLRNGVKQLGKYIWIKSERAEWTILYIVDIILIQFVGQKKDCSENQFSFLFGFCFGGKLVVVAEHVVGNASYRFCGSSLCLSRRSTLDDVVKSTKQSQAHGTLTISGNSSRPWPITQCPFRVNVFAEK